MITGKKSQICGLVGEKLGHSFSPQIHSNLANYKYSLFEVKPDSLGDFIRSDKYDSVNITIPYKVSVMKYLDKISDTARRIGSVNAVTHAPDGTLYGDNTDYYGFVYMLNHAGIDVRNKKVLVLGSGGASKTAKVACVDLGAKEVVIVSRSGQVNYENVYSLHQDANIIVNCTPVGMYPNNGDSPIDITKFPLLVGVADIIFNPAKTKLLLCAEEMNIKHANGLSMLVAQAKAACELFCNEKISDSEIDRITNIISYQTQNIILIGMPGCGKTTVGKLVADKLGREFADTDVCIESSTQMSIPDIFKLHGEDAFRQIESENVRNIGKKTGMVIATGGGVVTRSENYFPLRQNGMIFFIKRDPDLLDKSGRPLSLSIDLQEMYSERLPLYRKFSDFEIENQTPEQVAYDIINIVKKETHNV